ncbi:transcriptional regulator, MarR family [Noviherbaspirillum humi]|uniref:Transcriptional regulator, MarR family n=2 Tax=Noviherbaspirillum humi TaxID=1688639 RepID=A0A239HR12_9BURK|nr:transcriptional regulator, MarR family [Noviherbaspirillum humi]
MMRRAFERRLGRSSLTLAQARALLYLSRNEGLRQVELAAMLEVQPITLARLIDQLEAAGMVERLPDPDDRRAYKLYLTKAAAPHLAAINDVIRSIHADALRSLGRQQVDSLGATLGSMRENMGAQNRERDRESA